MHSVRRLIVLLLFAFAPFALPAPGLAQVVVSITVAPPPLPVYVQPVIPGPGYLWTPGYWAWGPYGYYWVPGTWVLPPAVGLLWTPGYWWWNGGIYAWRVGYWGPRVGFYGGVNYGFGYIGVGYAGGFWDHGAFRYNTAVNNIRGMPITNVYNKTVINNGTVTRVSYNGGQGGLTAQPNANELAAERESHVQATALQQQHEHAASTNHALLASVNHGRPAIGATRQPAVFTGRGVVSARGPGPRPNAGAPQTVHPAGGPNAHPPAAGPHPQNAPAKEGGPPHPGGERHEEGR